MEKKKKEKLRIVLSKTRFRSLENDTFRAYMRGVSSLANIPGDLRFERGRLPFSDDRAAIASDWERVGGYLVLSASSILQK